MTVPKERYMFAASQPKKWGLAMHPELGLRQSDDEGYWGVYRHRLGDVGDDYASEYSTKPSKQGGGIAKGEDGKDIIVIPERLSTMAGGLEEEMKIRRGRVSVVAPDNLCFVREGQRQSGVQKEEMDIWLAKIAPHAKGWIEHLDEQRAKNGVISFTTHVGHESPNIEDQGGLAEANDDGPAAAVDTDALPETNQLAYFLDLAHFEKAGKSHKAHVQLRKTVMEVYGPGGEMSKLGKAELFVELCILKKGDLEAEYVGCIEKTGLMWLEGL